MSEAYELIPEPPPLVRFTVTGPLGHAGPQGGFETAVDRDLDQAELDRLHDKLTASFIRARAIFDLADHERNLRLGRYDLKKSAEDLLRRKAEYAERKRGRETAFQDAEAQVQSSAAAQSEGRRGPLKLHPQVASQLEQKRGELAKAHEEEQDNLEKIRQHIAQTEDEMARRQMEADACRAIIDGDRPRLAEAAE